MSTIPKELRYTKEHEWVKLEGDVAIVGITDWAQEKLGEVIYVELPEVGKRFEAMEAIATVESVKAASDVYAPVAGEVIETNQSIVQEPGLVNKSPYGEGWFVRLKVEDPAQVEKLLTAENYEEFLKQQSEGS